jgi:hypothetical protein
VKWSIVAALAASHASDARTALIEEFRRPQPNENLGWQIGEALSHLADGSAFDDIAALLRDRRYERARQQLCLALVRTRDPRAETAPSRRSTTTTSPLMRWRRLEGSVRLAPDPRSKRSSRIRTSSSEARRSGSRTDRQRGERQALERRQGLAVRAEARLSPAAYAPTSGPPHRPRFRSS